MLRIVDQDHLSISGMDLLWVTFQIIDRYVLLNGHELEETQGDGEGQGCAAVPGGTESFTT